MNLSSTLNYLYNMYESDLSFDRSKFKNSVVKQNGKLIVCYHGSNHEFSDFNTDLIWASPDLHFAQDYGSSIKQVYLNITNPFEMGDHSEPIGDFDYISKSEFDLKPSEEFLFLINNLHLDINKVIVLLKKYYLRHREDFETFVDMACWTLWFIPEIIDQVKSLGYDGLSGVEFGSQVYAAFDTKQVYIINSLTEDTRTLLISKSRNTGGYKDTSRGKNRFERKRYSKVANSVRQYNQIDMNKLFKQDILIVKIPVVGETDNYTVTVKMEGVIAEIQKNIKNNKNKFEFRTVIQSLTKIFNTTNIYINCTCPDHLYNYEHWNIVNNVSTEDTAHDPGPGKGIKNPNDDKGRGCKHVLLVLSNGDWLMKVASVINNYVHYAEEHLQKPFLKLIFPKLYGIPAGEAVEQDLIDDDKYLDSSKGFIDAINEYGRNRGKIKKGSNRNPVANNSKQKLNISDDKAQKGEKTNDN